MAIITCGCSKLSDIFMRFRDYLNEQPIVATEYETMKLRLWKQYEHNRDAYTDAKTDFISRWTVEAQKDGRPTLTNRDL